jgi:hypothetical protein
MEVYPNLTLGGLSSPGIGWGGYFQTILKLARQCDAAGKSISLKHKAMIKQTILKNPRRAANSEDQQIISWQKKRLHG